MSVDLADEFLAVAYNEQRCRAEQRLADELTEWLPPGSADTFRGVERAPTDRLRGVRINVNNLMRVPAHYLRADPWTWNAVFCAMAMDWNQRVCARGLDRWEDDGGPCG